MRSFFSQFAALSAVVLILAPAQAEEATPAQELRDLRQAVQQQSKQIELLAEQVARLTRALDSQKNPAGAAVAAEPPKSTPEFATDVPKAETVNAGPRHVVVKGETLTSIAKQYNIPINELKTANKIENERKLQIGQVLILPTPKAPETSDKKENP